MFGILAVIRIQQNSIKIWQNEGRNIEEIKVQSKGKSLESQVLLVPKTKYETKTEDKNTDLIVMAEQGICNINTHCRSRVTQRDS